MDKLTKGGEGRRDGRFPGVTGGVCKKRGWAAFAEGACPGRDKGFPPHSCFSDYACQQMGAREKAGRQEGVGRIAKKAAVDVPRTCTEAESHFSVPSWLTFGAAHPVPVAG